MCCLTRLLLRAALVMPCLTSYNHLIWAENTFSFCFWWMCIWTDHISVDCSDKNSICFWKHYKITVCFWVREKICISAKQTFSLSVCRGCWQQTGWNDPRVVPTVALMYTSVLHVYWNRVCLWCIRKLCLWCNRYTQHGFTNAPLCTTLAAITMATK